MKTSDGAATRSPAHIVCIILDRKKKPDQTLGMREFYIANQKEIIEPAPENKTKIVM